MRRWAAGVFGLLLLLPFAPACGAPLEAYGRLPTLDHIVISPDGRRLAYMKEVNGQRFVVVQDLDSQDAPGILRLGDQKLRDIRWADNDHVLITTSQTASIAFLIGPRQEWHLTTCYDIPRKQQWQLLGSKGDVEALNVSVDYPEARNVDGRTIVYVEGFYYPERKGVLALFAVDLETHHARLVEGKSESASGWLVDAQGKAVAEEDYRESSRHWSLRFKRGGAWPEVLGVDAPLDTPDIIGLTANDSAVLVRVPTETGYESKLVSFADGSVSAAPDEMVYADEFIVDPATDRVIGSARTRTTTKYTFFDKNDRAAWDSIAAAYNDEELDFVSWSADHKKIVVQVQGARDGDMFELANLDTNLGADLGRAYDGIGRTDLSPVTEASYKAADGFQIPAYLTLPRDRAAKNLALVVLPHGGPWARDYPGFDWWAQALASRGYAVLQPQFRGSSGFGWKHLSAGFGEFGRKMQTDLSDGVRMLAAKGTIDPKRVCIVGGSYGGYAALAGPTLDPGIYRCAVSVAGISDLRDFLSWERSKQDRSDSLAMRYWLRFLGAEKRDDPALDKISPIKFIDKIDDPILLIHGRDDTRVPIAQSESMADALKAAGKAFTFVELESEDHFLSRSETRLQMLKATVDFLETNNPP